MKKIENNKILSKLEKTLLVKCSNAIKSIDPNADVILYGSRARGDAVSDSDYDLLILVDGNASLEKEDLIRAQLFPIEIETGCVLTIVTYSRKDWNSSLYKVMPFYQNIEKDGVVL